MDRSPRKAGLQALVGLGFVLVTLGGLYAIATNLTRTAAIGQLSIVDPQTRSTLVPAVTAPRPRKATPAPPLAAKPGAAPSNRNVSTPKSPTASAPNAAPQTSGNPILEPSPNDDPGSPIETPPSPDPSEPPPTSGTTNGNSGGNGNSGSGGSGGNGNATGNPNRTDTTTSVPSTQKNPGQK